jgi:phosphate transport system substrate-binding protein
MKRLWALGALCLLATANLTRAQSLTGAGATFPYPIYSKWFIEYSAAHPGVKINYQSLGSGAGIRQVTAGTVDFGAADVPMTDDQLAASKVKIVHIPTVLGAVVPIFNIKGVKDLKLGPDVIAEIYLGKITTWNDPRLVKDNPGVSLPNEPIFIVHRAEGSGTTFIFTDYLSKVSPDWMSTAGKGAASPNWPVGIGAKGNEGVAAMVRQVEGAIGYVELIYALQNNINYGWVKNASGVWLKATTEGVSAAAAGAKIPADYRVSITNAPGKDAYPISSFTWLLIPNPPKDAKNGAVIKDFLNWMLDKGEAETTNLHYAPLPPAVVTRVKATIGQLK